MTTAHRPTFDPARGKEVQQGPAYHQRLLPAHRVLKQRQRGQGGIGGLNAEAPVERDLRHELLKAEAAVRARKNGGVDPEAESNGSKRKNSEGDEATDEAAEDGEEDPEAKRRRLILEEAHDVDADSDDDEAKSSDESDEDDEDEDEEAELLRELAKIKAERAAQRAKEEADKAAKEQEEREVEIARGNPLLNGPGGAKDFGVKRRWDDDVVFKNQARGTEERGRGKEFVNDLLRSDFHKKFMSKYVR